MDKVKLTIESYRKISKEYIAKHLHDRIMNDKLEMFAKTLSNGALVLDVGFGSVRDMRYFREHGFRVMGIDLCDEFLEEAKKEGFEVYKMDMRDLKFEDEKFDGLWVAGSLYHVPLEDLPRTIEGFHRILKFKGSIFVSVKKGEGDGVFEIKFGKTTISKYYNYFNEKVITHYFSEWFEIPQIYSEPGEYSEWLYFVGIRR